VETDRGPMGGVDRLRFSTSDAEVFRNSTVILMSAAGRSKGSIAQDLGCCRRPWTMFASGIGSEGWRV